MNLTQQNNTPNPFKYLKIFPFVRIKHFKNNCDFRGGAFALSPIKYFYDQKWKKYVWASKIHFIIMLLPVLSVAQIKISGKVKNSKGDNLSYVTITLLKDSSAIIGKSVTDNLGEFKLSLQETSPMVLKASRIGYNDFLTKLLLEDSKDVNLNIILEESSKTLSQVNITSDKAIYERKVDRFIFNVQNSALATGSNAFEAIAKSPGMSSNANTLNMIGKGGVKVLINNRDIRLSGNDLYTYLSSVPSESISAIEIITSPGAQYDAEGDAGIVNIIIKKNLSEGLLLILTSTYEQRKNPSGGENVSFNNRSKNVNIYGFANVNYNQTVPEELTSVYFNNSTWDTKNSRDIRRLTSSFQIGVDFDLSKKSTLSILSEGTFYNHTKESADAVTKAYNFPLGGLDSVQNLQNNIKRNLAYKNFDANYKYIIDSLGSSLTLGGDYLFYNSKQDQSLLSESYKETNLLQTLSSSSTSPQAIDIYVAKLDFDKRLRLRQNFTFGLKTTGTSIGNDYKFFNTNTGSDNLLSGANSNYFIYRENIHAIYSSYGKDWENDNIVVGLRSEYTIINTESRTLGTKFRNKYIKLFPSIFYMHVFNENHKLNLNYNRRINRPAYWELNPFKYFTSAYSYAEGNPDLKPSYVNNFQLNYTFRNKYFLNGYMQIENDHFQQVPMIDPSNNNYYYTRRNVGTIKTYGLQTFIPVKPTKFWNINAQLNLFLLSQNTAYLNDFLKYNKLNLYINLANQFFLDKKKTFYSELNFIYNSPKQVFLNQSDGYGYFDFGLKKSIGKGSLGLNIFDVLGTIPYTVRVRYNNQNSDFKNDYESRFLRLSFTYKLGKQTVKDKKTRQTSNSEEKNRLN